MVQRTQNGEFTTKGYRKATHTDQVLNYESNHLNTHKRSCIRTLFKRATTHCSTPELQKAEEEHLSKVFAKNGYPRNFINRCQRERQQNEDMPQPKGLATLPYIRSISELTTRLLRPLGLITAHKPTATLRQQLTRTKDPIPNMSKTNVVYKIPCKDCTKHYIRQTGRQLTNRIHEHQLATKRHDQLSLVATHTDDKQHEFDWDNTTITGQAKQRTAREFLEAWHSSTDSINKHIDLDPIYWPLQRTDRTDNRKRQRQATINAGGNSTEALHRRLPSTEDVTSAGDETFARLIPSSANRTTTTLSSICLSVIIGRKGSDVWISEFSEEEWRRLCRCISHSGPVVNNNPFHQLIYVCIRVTH
ncbi:uncharacterized protein [Chiloscyllium punctatum]|uniref:uncharacterized protein n=1 Tax=Chiloscyllium punctatum TaxID=137246 RepID=UPI003B63DCFA